MTHAAVEIRQRLVTAPLYGTFIKLPALEVVDILAASAFDFAVIDLEHSQLSESDARRLLRHATALDLPTLVRVPTIDSGAINRLLESGAVGIQLSTLISVEQVQDLCDSTRYPPRGRRSISLSHPAAAYGATGINSYLESEAAGPLLVGQIETASTKDTIAELTQHLDVAFIGTTDLSVDLGVPGDVGHAAVGRRIDQIVNGLAEGVHLGGWVSSPEQIGVVAAQGARYVMVGSDIQLLKYGIDHLAADLDRSCPAPEARIG